MSDLTPEELFAVVVNTEEQYSLWPAHREVPDGWRQEGTTGSREACLAKISETWTDMRPLSLRREMDRQAHQAS
ncbi:MbtH family protein [Streptomyces chryseus]